MKKQEIIEDIKETNRMIIKGEKAIIKNMEKCLPLMTIKQLKEIKTEQEIELWHINN